MENKQQILLNNSSNRIRGMTAFSIYLDDFDIHGDVPVKPLVIYHGSCIDGYGAKLALWLKFRDTWEYYAGYYKEQYPDVKDRDIILVDFCYKEKELLEILEVAKSVTILDHHLSASKEVGHLVHPKLHMNFDMDRSGAVLAYNFAFPGEEIPLFFQLIEDRDLWKFKLPDSKAFNASLSSYDYNIEVWNSLYQYKSISSMIKEGEAIIRKQNKDIDELLKVMTKKVNILGYDVPCANLPYIFSSEAGQILSTGELFSATYYDTPTSRVFSFRSDKNGIDVSAIAQQLGGGGHFSASGAAVPLDHELAKI